VPLGVGWSRHAIRYEQGTELIVTFRLSRPAAVCDLLQIPKLGVAIYHTR